MTTQEIINYYAGLLILQYIGKPKAFATIQTLVTGPIMDQLPLQVQNGFTLGDTTIADVTYPGAIGVQLDILGKYAGVVRTGSDLNGNIVTLNDMDFTTLIRLAIVTNNSGSSLADIQNLLHTYFANEIFVYDGADMQMSYLVTSSVGSQALVELFITEGLLPKPMGVQLSSVIYVPSVSLFGFQTYDSVAPAWIAITNYGIGNRVMANSVVYASLVNNNLNHVVTDTNFWIAVIYPFNTYDTYPVYKPYTWLTYDDTITLI